MAEKKGISEEIVPEKKEISLEELIQKRTEKLAGIDSSILTTQRLIQGGSIKVLDNNETEKGKDVLELAISGSEMVQSMLTPTLSKLLKDRGSVSFDLDRFKAIKSNEESKQKK